ncbi:protein Wnt-2b-A-like isoform X1 [Styela clava]
MALEFLCRDYYNNYHRPTSNIIIVLIIVNYCGMFPVAQSSWLFFSKFQGLPHTIGPRICDQMSLVPKQKEMCLDDPKVMVSVGEGAFNGIAECQYQFRTERWNCSTIEKGQTVFGKVINPGEVKRVVEGSREASFVHAITAAGVMYSVTRACSRGDINSCSCDRRKRGDDEDREGKFTWGGCSDDIGNGTYFVREFVDASEINVHDARAEMNLHNNRAGRRAVKKFVKRQCKCHGKTGSCYLRTCWEAMGEFRLTGDYLKAKYNNAVRVTVTHNGPNTAVETGGELVSADKLNPPSKNDLVYLENSPNYCTRNAKIGTYGTGGRECNATSTGNDGCDKLCCGRGYTTKKVTRIEDCMCEFHWCCEVKCQKCNQTIDIHTCKEEDEFDISHVDAIPSTTSPSTTTVSTTKAKRRKGKGRKGKRRKGSKRKRGKGRRKGNKSKKRDKRDVKNFYKTDNYRTRFFSRAKQDTGSQNQRIVSERGGTVLR